MPSSVINGIANLSQIIRNYVSHTIRKKVKKLTEIIKNSKIIAFFSLIFRIMYAYFQYLFVPSKLKIELHYQKSPDNEELIKKLTLLKNTKFIPTFYLVHPMLQFLYGIIPLCPRIDYYRDYVILSDGGQICIDWALPLKKIIYKNNPHKNKLHTYEPPIDNKIMFIIHGAVGGSETEFIKYLVYYAQLNGYRVAALNHRGINQKLTNHFPTHGGSLDDFEAGLAFVKQRYPQAPVVAVGLSFGGNQLLRYLGNKKNKSELIAGVSISSPFDTEHCLDAMKGNIFEKAIVKYYMDMTFVPSLDSMKALEITHGIDFNTVLSSKSIRDFHHHFTIKLYNHKDVSEYFRASYVDEKIIEDISIPTLYLYSKDDPIVSKESIPIDNLKKNKNIIYAETNYGSHLCWFTGIKPKPWYPQVVVEYFEAILSDISTKRH